MRLKPVIKPNKNHNAVPVLGKFITEILKRNFLNFLFLDFVVIQMIREDDKVSGNKQETSVKSFIK